MTHGVWRSVELFNQQEMLRETRQRMMQLDFSWEASVRAYLDLYERMRRPVI
jgi:starch synthase